jgi:hypothetical protein
LEQINGGQEFINLDDISASDFNKLVENIQYLYRTGGEVELNAYPIGSVYISKNETSPAELFGGTWLQIKDVFLIATGKRSPGSEGGEENHTLTLYEMPKHAGHLYLNEGVVYQGNQAAEGKYLNESAFSTYGEQPRGWNVNTVEGGSTKEMYPVAHSVGGDGAHNNMPPYEAYNMWRRTA